MGLFKRSDSARMSLPEKKVVHGITLGKLTVGDYIQSMSAIQDLPQQILEACYPDEGILAIAAKAKAADNEFVLDLVSRLALCAPDFVIDLAQTYICQDRDKLLNLSPAELMDVLEAWWALNDLTDFFGRVWSKIKPALAPLQTITGSSAGSPSPKASGSGKKPS